MIIVRRSPWTGKEHVMDINVTPQQLEAWTNGKYIQDAMPNLTASEREFILTGYSPEDWDQMFPAEEDCA